MKLTEKYRSMLALEKAAGANGHVDYSQELDSLYRMIVNAPIHTLSDAQDKLSFALHCMSEEEDWVEAERLVSQVCHALSHVGQLLILGKSTRSLSRNRLVGQAALQEGNFNDATERTGNSL